MRFLGEFFSSPKEYLPSPEHYFSSPKEYLPSPELPGIGNILSEIFNYLPRPIFRRLFARDFD